VKDFFISFNKADKDWAEWVAWTLEEVGYSVIFQKWDFQPGHNFVLKMQEAAAGTVKTVAVLSEDYLNAEYTHPEWAAAFARDPQGKDRTLIPVIVKSCNPEGLLASIIWIELIGLSEEEAHNALLRGLRDRDKPNEPPLFPGARSDRSSVDRVIAAPVQFPGTTVAETNTEIIEPDTPWNIPQGVPFFTGREDVLQKLADTLASRGAAALAQRQAITGLGGIGKTQTAIEYANRHRAEYKVGLWAVAESRETLISDFVAIASMLKMPEANIQDQNFTVTAVKRWLEGHSDWLLILDNADDPKVVEEFLPVNSKGHILLTSRAQVFDDIGIMSPVELDEMSPPDARMFLLRRTGREELDTGEEKAVEELAKVLDYLPLALEQAGAYIKVLRSSFGSYIASYRKRGLALLEKSGPVDKYKKSVKTTWSLNFEQVEQASKASAELLRASAFLNPDRIPNELISAGATELGPEISAVLAEVESDPLVLDELFQPLIRYSLIHRNRKTKTYDIHRLVQVVLKEEMDNSIRRLWIERVIKAVGLTFPRIDPLDASEWDDTERLLSHAQLCTEYVFTYSTESQEAARFLNALGRYLHFRARLVEAESLYKKSLEIRERVLGRNNPDVATSLHNLGWLYYDQSRYSEAKPLYLRALEIRRMCFGFDHPDVATTLVGIANLYIQQGDFAQAEEFLREAMSFREKYSDADILGVAECLGIFGHLYLVQGRYSEAELLCQQALELKSRVLENDHFKMAPSLSTLGRIYANRGWYNEAAPLFLQSLSIVEKAYGGNHPIVADILRELAWIYLNQDEDDKAGSLVSRALEIMEDTIGAENTRTGVVLSVLGQFLKKKRLYSKAEVAYLRALNIQEKASGSDHPEYATGLYNLADLYQLQRKPSKAEPLLKRALEIRRKYFGLEHEYSLSVMFRRADVLRAMNRKGEAQKLEAQAIKIQNRLNKKSRK
jgi:tetratricopeptide (TPR) repeat protein